VGESGAFTPAPQSNDALARFHPRHDKPSVPISSTRLSSRLHHKAYVLCFSLSVFINPSSAMTWDAVTGLIAYRPGIAVVS
jgi:hypothetical protein